MKPYYQDDAVTIYHGDCLEIVPALSGRFDCCLVDPPYGKVKGDFDELWTNRAGMLIDCTKWRDILFDAMNPNATLWWFAWTSLAGRIEALLAERLNPLSHVVWIKPAPTAQRHCLEELRAPAPETERIIMAEHYGADNWALGEPGYIAKSDEPRGFMFEPLRLYLASEMKRAGFNKAKVNKEWRSEKGGRGGMAHHWFTNSQWALPTAETYAWLRRLFNGERPTEYLRREYEDLRREYEYLRREYEYLRRYFSLEQGDPKTELWRFPPSGNKHGHPTEKPIALLNFMVRISCRPGGAILDCFAGSGTTGRAAKDSGRKAVLVEREERYCEIAARRMAQNVLCFDPTPSPPHQEPTPC